jgi:peptide deformylase
MSILVAPDPVLRTVADPVERFDRRLRKLRDRMLVEMYEAPGVGLAAPQVGRALRFFVYDDKQGHSGAVANPIVLPLAAEGHTRDVESCLSVPGKRYEVRRWRAVILCGWDVRGQEIELRARGFLARIVQHEVDHLAGILLPDRTARGRESTA